MNGINYNHLVWQCVHSLCKLSLILILCPVVFDVSTMGKKIAAIQYARLSSNLKTVAVNFSSLNKSWNYKLVTMKPRGSFERPNCFINVLYKRKSGKLVTTMQLSLSHTLQFSSKASGVIRDEQ